MWSARERTRDPWFWAQGGHWCEVVRAGCERDGRQSEVAGHAGHSWRSLQGREMREKRDKSQLEQLRQGEPFFFFKDLIF